MLFIPGLFSCRQLSKGPSIPWDCVGQVEDLTGVCFFSFTIPIGVSSSLAAPVPESQKGQGPGPVSGAQQVAAGMVWHPSCLRVVSGTSSGGTGSHCGVGCILGINPLFLLPSAFAIITGTLEESEHGQCSAALHLGVLRAQSSLSVASMLLQQYSPGPALW